MCLITTTATALLWVVRNIPPTSGQLQVVNQINAVLDIIRKLKMKMAKQSAVVEESTQQETTTHGRRGAPNDVNDANDVNVDGRAKQRHSKPSTNMAVRLLQWNVNGILAHCQEFQQLLAIHNFDIICIQESFLKPDKDYCPTGYNSVRSNRPTAKGGLITFIRNGLIYTQARRPADMECQAVNVRTSLGTITVISVYEPPTHDAVPPLFEDLFQQNNIIIVGDMNPRNRLWRSNTNDARGRALEDAIIAHGYVVLNTGVGTYQTYHGSMTHIDVSLASSQLATKCRWATFNNTMGSDHVPIIITINARPERQRITAPKWKSAEADWNVFRDCINDQIDDDVDQLNSKIVDIIRSAAEQSIPRTKPSVPDARNL